MYEILSTCKGGGYMYCKTNPPHPKANVHGQYALHRVLAENKIGRPLKDWEDVHHRDFDKNNNDPDNLRVLSKSEHGKIHAKVVDNVVYKCLNCGKQAEAKPGDFRRRLKQTKRKGLCCSKRCSGLFREDNQ